MSEHVDPPILNPHTPLAFFERTLAQQVAASGYIYVGCLAIMLWDFLSSIPEDFVIVKTRGLPLPAVIYVVSRLSTVSWFVYGGILNTAPLFDECSAAVRGFTWTYAVAVALTSLLFALRVRAIYNDNKWISLFIISLWLGVVGGAIFVPLDTARHSAAAFTIGPTSYCDVSRIWKEFSAFSSGTTYVYSIAAFMAINWRIMWMNGFGSHLETNARLRTLLVCPRTLPAFARGAVKDGQKYYLIASAFSFVGLVVVIAPVSMPLKAFCVISNLLMMNTMASRVFRRTAVVEQLESQSNIYGLPNSSSKAPVALMSHLQFTRQTEVAYEDYSPGVHEKPALEHVIVRKLSGLFVRSSTFQRDNATGHQI